MNEPTRQPPRLWGIIYCLAALLLLWSVGRSFQPGHGFTSLITFGDYFDRGNLSGLGCRVLPNSFGYDGQFYAKLALNPLLLHPIPRNEIDNPTYRARRILLSWTAWLIGMGKPAWIVQVFALQNVACWLMLAWLLTKWFPPLDLNNFIRWSGILFSTGMIESMRHSLTDGPSAGPVRVDARNQSSGAPRDL
jgi:hypothetical protein